MIKRIDKDRIYDLKSINLIQLTTFLTFFLRAKLMKISQWYKRQQKKIPVLFLSRPQKKKVFRLILQALYSSLTEDIHLMARALLDTRFYQYIISCIGKIMGIGIKFPKRLYLFTFSIIFSNTLKCQNCRVECRITEPHTIQIHPKRYRFQIIDCKCLLPTKNISFIL